MGQKICIRTLSTNSNAIIEIMYGTNNSITITVKSVYETQRTSELANIHIIKILATSDYYTPWAPLFFPYFFARSVKPHKRNFQ